MDYKFQRLLAAAVDFYIICAVGTLMTYIITSGETKAITLFIHMFICEALMLVKDLPFKNASIGKRIFGLKIVKTDDTELKATDLLKRNVPPILLLPIELQLLIFSKERIGDNWAKTKVVRAKSSANLSR